MTEKSQFWYTNGFTGATGDGAAPYTQEEFRAHNDALFGEGVVAGAENELAVSGTASPLAVATGRAQVNGFHYWNDASKNLTVTTPIVGTTGGRVVLRADWTAATVRLAVLLNTDGVATIPALTQTSGTLYEISLASFTVTTGGVITLADTRAFAGAGLDRTADWRVGGSSTDWQSPGTTNYRVGIGRVVAGSSVTNGSGQQAVSYPVAFAKKPAIILSPTNYGVFALASSTSVSGFLLLTKDNAGNAVASETVNWIAVGEIA